jgi:hypothetical protein
VSCKSSSHGPPSRDIVPRASSRVPSAATVTTMRCEPRFVAVPTHLAVGHLDRVPARDITLVEVDHRERAGGVVGADDRHRARNLRLVDLRAHQHERTALVPLERCAAVERRARDEGMPPGRAPHADQWRQRFECGIGPLCFRADRGRHRQDVARQRRTGPATAVRGHGEVRLPNHRQRPAQPPFSERARSSRLRAGHGQGQAVQSGGRTRIIQRWPSGSATWAAKAPHSRGEGS